MKVLFYQTTENRHTDNVMDTLRELVTDDQVHVATGIQAFIKALIKYRIEGPIVVIQVSDIEDVAEIKGLSDILDGLFLIVVADNDNARLFKSCRQLYPRLLTSIEGDFGVIAAVIEKRLAMSSIQLRVLNV